MAGNRLALILFGALLRWCCAAATADQRQRIHKLEGSLIAQCCYSGVVSRHSSDVAVKMRLAIAAWVTEGKSDREILEAYEGLYGMRVLTEPEGPAWWWSSLVPWFVLATGAFLTAGTLRKWRRFQEPTTAAASGTAIPIPDFNDPW
jgi:cytochrome c-type biogenesis protein CcmH/NrfF